MTSNLRHLMRCAFPKCKREPFVHRKSKRGQWFLLCKECYILIEKCAGPDDEGSEAGSSDSG